MERRYLAATIAMAATFALFSHAFSSGFLTRVHDPRATLISEVHCAAQTLRAHLLDKVNRSLGVGNAEEAQLRVEFNLPAPPLAPAPPAAVPMTASAQPMAVACPSQPLVADRMSRNFERAQARAIKLQQKAFAEQAKIQSKALETQARLMAVQARLTSETMQRELTRVAMAQARTSIAQARISAHPCSGARTVHVVSRSDDNDTDVNIDLDQLSNQIEQQVSRSLRNTVRNF